ncbi:MAG: L-2-hydroxyglutarate oxidase [Verrucomicrobiaceae bacterium]|nr:MAG: L-2-hydroxyglutarate oxidase [Verrucomicrobiaceae bacterium]
MSRFDYIIIGGGIVGLSVAHAILNKRPGVRLALLEKESDWAKHQTGRNSGVIHSGIYYKPGSLKAALCREGNRQLLEFCDMYGIKYDVCGKVIVATKAAEVPLLETLAERGSANGLTVQRMNAVEVNEVEPHVKCLAGLRIPSTGIVSYTQICRKLAELIQQRGGEMRLGAQARKIRVINDSVMIETDNGELEARWIVNCAGLHSDRVVRLTGSKPEAQIVPFRGEYYELKTERRTLVRHLIYPVPDPKFPFLGVHFTRMIDGSVHAGPNAVLSLKREGYHRTAFDLRDAAETMLFPGFWRLAARHAKTGLQEIHRSLSKQAFVRSLQQLIPEVQADDLVPSAAGVRAQALRRDGSLVDDFMISAGERTIHVYNAPSPAATASLEIGRTIAEQVPE